MRSERFLLLVLCIAWLACTTWAQNSSEGTAGGAPAGVVFKGSDIDNVSMNNGGLTLRIPYSETPGRGLSSGQFLVYNSKGYYMSEFCSGSTCNYFAKPVKNSQLIPAVASTAGIRVNSSTYQTSCDGGQTNTFIAHGYSVIEPDGTSHHMVPDPQGGWGCQVPANATRYADDGSGWIFQPGNPGKVFRKDGTINQVEDTNGNQLAWGWLNDPNGTFVGVTTDTLGRTVPSGYYDASGTSRGWTISTTPITASTNLCFMPTPPSTCSEYTGSIGNAPTQITLPNGLGYAFQHNGTDITSVTLPTGAVISYTYTQFLGDYSGSRVASRTVTANGQSAHWTYTYAEPSPDVFTTTVLDPYNNQTVYTCTPMGNSPPPPDIVPGFPSCQITDVSYYSGTTVLMKTVHTDYWGGLGALPKAITTTTYSTVPGDASVNRTRVEMDYDGQVLTFPGEQDNFSRGNLTERREFIYDSSGNNPQLVRRTDFAYLHDSDSRYAALNIANRMTDTIVYDCSGGQCTPGPAGLFSTPYTGGTRVSEVQNSYDSTPLLNANGSPSPVTVPGHDDANFPTANTLRGNLTQTRVWLNTNNTWLTTTNNYDVLGHIISSTDPGNHTTSFSYSDDWNGWSAQPACLPSTNSYAFLTDTTNAKGQHSHTTYFPCTGQVQSAKDQNDINNSRAGTTFTYDAMKRMLNKTVSDGGQTSFSYNDSLSDLSSTETSKITGTLNHVVKTSYDALGRTTHTALLSDPDGVTYTDITYDLMGRQATVTNPYRSTSEPTYGITSYVYDALGRNTMVVPPDGSIYFNNSTVTFGGSYTITTDQAGKRRKRYFDSLGRVVQVDEPAAASTGGAQSIGGFTITGAEQNHNQPGAYASGTVTIGGSVHQVRKCDPQCNFITDTGNVNINVAGAGSASAGYGGTSDTPTTIATQLAAGFGNNSLVSASSSAGTVTLVARAPGPAYSFTTSQSWDTFDFTSPQITIGPASGSISGGVYPSFSYDAGQVSITVAGYTATVNYDQNSSTSSVASALVNILNGDIKSPVTAALSGSTINLASKTVGSQANYTLSSNSITTQFSFSSPSFTAAPSGANMINGADTSNPFASVLSTFYAYDALNNLTRVEQHGGSTDPAQWRVRTFTYDSLSHLTQSNNPETGLITFVYDSEGKPASKTSPAPNQPPGSTLTVTANYQHDELHRLTYESFSDGTYRGGFAYDETVSSSAGNAVSNGIGRMTSSWEAWGGQGFSYDTEGRPVLVRRVVEHAADFQYAYNLDGSVKTLQYPSGRVMTYTPGPAGRPISAVDSNGTNYVTGATYAPDGSESGFLSGSSAGFSGVTNSFLYNPREQLCRITAFTSGSAPGSCSDTASHGNVLDLGYNYNLAAGDNGNVTAVTNYRDPSRSQAFTYDALNRITSGSSAAGSGALSWGENYMVDAWGNLMIAPMSGKANGGNFQCAGDANNRATCLGYDAAGNMIGNGAASYTYDAGNMLKTVGGTTYWYDAAGRRFLKWLNGTPVKSYFYGAEGEILAEGSGGSTLTAEYIYFNGRRIARVDLPANTVHYYLSDHLGSASMVVSSSGTIEEESDYSPFGTEFAVSSTGANRYKFNGKERDAETGLDSFGARYYASTMGRWPTPDWSKDPTPVPYANMDNPQSLNLYEYALSNPTTLPDLDGHLTPLGSCCGGGPENADGPSATETPEQQREEHLAAQTQGAATNQPAAQQTEGQQQNQPQKQQSQSSNPNSSTGSGRVNSPAGGGADSTIRIPGNKPGSYTDRTYGPDGRATKDIDHGHDHGAGDPHAHDWDWSKKSPRQPGRPLTPEEAASIQKSVSTAAKAATVGVIIYWIVSEASRLFLPRNLIPIP